MDITPEPRSERALGRKGVKRTPDLERAIGARIRAVRVAAGISQTALGQIAGISFQQVQKYELGKDRVAASTLQVFAKALNVPPGSFFDHTAVQPASVPEVRDIVQIGRRIQRVRDAAVLRRLLALADVLADRDGGPSLDSELP